MNECISKKCITMHQKQGSSVSERSGTCLIIRNMPIIRGQILGRVWPVWSSAACALPKLTLHPEIPSFLPILMERAGLSVFCLNCAFNTAPMRAKDLAVCSSLFFFF